MHLHVICKDGLNHKHLQGDEYETGEWVSSEGTAKVVTKVFLHENQKKRAFHGGEVIGWRPGVKDPARKIFRYRATRERPLLDKGWGREKALVAEEDLTE